MRTSAEASRCPGRTSRTSSAARCSTDAPALTLTSGHAAVHQALTGDRLRLPLDAELSRAVTGARGAARAPEPRLRRRDRPVDGADPAGARQPLLPRPDAAHAGVHRRHAAHADRGRGAEAEPRRAGRLAPPAWSRCGSGPTNQRGEPVLDFWRCPMIPLRDPQADDRARRPLRRDPGRARARARSSTRLPAGWDFDGAARGACPESASPTLEAGTVYEVEGRDTVTAAPELARLTLNVAKAHTDAGGSAHGRRLVYGGHTISIAAAHLSRALPATGDDRRLARLRPPRAGVRGRRAARRTVEVEGRHELDGADAGLARPADGGRAPIAGEEEAAPVLDWRAIAVIC